jgi:hypothetical protein
MIREQEAQQIKESLKKKDDDDVNRFKPKTTVGRFEVPPEERMPLTHKYTAFDRKLREAGVSIPKDEITYRPVRLDSQNLGRRFQEAYIDPQDRTVLGVRRYEWREKTNCVFGEEGPAEVGTSGVRTSSLPVTNVE